ncbi:MAG: winged helix-turn-helix transcriptional regulator [Candidatus Heimdallarchaeota archaeon]|nr:MAG: winged helix-turn-helix transcriptional regulator [Candidatus Heimdallarchaeota archaeon]
MKHLGQLNIIILLLLVWFCSSSADSSISSLSNPNDSSSTFNTEIDIANAYLLYRINLKGEYSCSFRLEAISNALMVIKPAKCCFKINGTIKDLELKITGSNVEFNSSIVNNTTFISFSTSDHTFPEDFPFTINGNFLGNYLSNTSGILLYSFSIDWGTIVGAQRTNITFSDDFTIHSISPKQPYSIEINEYGNYFELCWVDMMAKGFETVIQLHPGQLPIEYEYLEVDLKNWTATIGQSKIATIRNIALLNITGFVITPNWISTNVSNPFHLTPNQSIAVRFKINKLASSGKNDSIKILVLDPFYSSRTLDAIVIPIYVTSGSSTNLFMIILQVLLLLSIFFVTGFLIHRNGGFKNISTNIKEFIQPKRNKTLEQPAKSSTADSGNIFAWEEIETEWKEILPEMELRILQVLYLEGIMNQKTLAEKVGISTMTTSRIISRLEMKRLIKRERLGMSKIIKINKDKL